jgi:hypothetical protein
VRFALGHDHQRRRSVQTFGLLVSVFVPHLNTFKRLIFQCRELNHSKPLMTFEQSSQYKALLKPPLTQSNSGQSWTAPKETRPSSNLVLQSLLLQDMRSCPSKPFPTVELSCKEFCEYKTNHDLRDFYFLNGKWRFSSFPKITYWPYLGKIAWFASNGWLLKIDISIFKATQKKI